MHWRYETHCAARPSSGQFALKDACSHAFLTASGRRTQRSCVQVSSANETVITRFFMAANGTVDTEGAAEIQVMHGLVRAAGCRRGLVTFI